MKKNYYGNAPFNFSQGVKKLLLTMRITLILSLCCILNLSASLNSSSQTFNLSLTDVKVKEVFKIIEEQSNFRFFYNDELSDINRLVSINVQNSDVKGILSQLLDQSLLSYKVLDNNLIVIAPKETLQQIKVSGTITDGQSGDPLPGVNIIIEGTTIGVTSDMNGKYTIEIPNQDAVLVFSYIGYLMERVQFAGQASIDVQLMPDIKTLEEVVVIGYGTTKKSDLTGSITSVSEKTIKERPVQNAIQAMQGKAAGVDIVSNVRPGEVASINIRGTRSLLATNGPLYVVDGIILMGSINDINPNDIASIEILKDASATAIYGSRGANGVILITTKNGSKGKLTVNYDGTVSFDNIHSLTDWASAGESLDRLRTADINGGQYLLGGTSVLYPDPQADINKYGNSDPSTISAIRKGYEWNDPGTFGSVKMRPATDAELAKGWPAQVPVYNSGNIPTTDWIDLLTRVSKTQNHLLSLSAGNENSKLYFSFGYLNNEGTQKNQGYNRYTAKINGDINPVKWLTVGTSVNASLTKQLYGTINRSGSATGAKDAYGMALTQYLMAQPYDENGNLIEYPGNNKAAPVWNPLIDLDNSLDERRQVNIQANFYSEVKFTNWLKYRLNFGSAFDYYRRGTWQGSQSTLRRTATPQTAAATYETKDNSQYLIENLLFFNKSFGNHTVGATLLYSAQDNRTENANISSSKILYDSPTWYNLSANLNGTPDSYGTGYVDQAIMSYMGRINYSFLNRYLLTASGRYDGASVLAVNNKWDFFPSFAVAWKMHEESFLKSISWINELKLRIGYGVTGNSAVNPYTTSGPLLQFKYAFGDIPAIGYVPQNMPNPKLGWEKTSQTNLGIDFSFISNRISGSIDLYKSVTSDLLMNRSLPPITGFTYIVDNIGKMQNKGLEISLSTVNISTKDFHWSTNLNWSTNKEEILELVNGKEDMKGNGWFIGQPINVFRTYTVAGLWQNTTDDLAEIANWKANGYTFVPGQYKPVEQNKNYKLEDDDKVIVGTPRPKWIAGMTNTFTYKNFELSSFIYARIGQSYFYPLQPGGMTGGSFVGYMRSEDLNNFWSSENTGAKWPQLTSAANVSNADVNRATYINNGSFIVVRNIALSYNVPSAILKKYNITNLQIYGQVLNPFIFGSDVVKAGINPDDTNGWTNVNSIGDPTGGTNNNTVIIRSWVLGVRIGL